jgi:serine/threonine-protein kinase
VALGDVSTGTQFGPYVIFGALGVGGMGQVWKASDTRLDRVVAIKVLPPELSQDLKSHQRFLLEAQAAASLNHESVLHNLRS